MPGGMISLIGGKVEQEGNTSDILEKTVRREVWEEVGVELGESLHYVHSTSFSADDGVPVIDIVFLCSYAGGQPTAKSPDEVEEVFWTNRNCEPPPPVLANSFTRLYDG